jgi:hypothetical protein
MVFRPSASLTSVDLPGKSPDEAENSVKQSQPEMTMSMRAYIALALVLGMASPAMAEVSAGRVSAIDGDRIFVYGVTAVRVRTDAG